MERPSGVEFKMGLDGKDNPKYVDLLDEDKPVAGQKFACVSFISPEKIVKQKEIFNFEQFLKQWDFTKSFEKYSQFLNFLSFKYNLDFDKLTEDLKGYVEEEKANITSSSLDDDYKNYLDTYEEKLDKEFSETHNFQTSTRGMKVRGSYPTQQEAELRCKMLREMDPNHDVFVGPVGMWMPFHPEAYKTGRVEYLEDELNQLMHEKKKNEDKAKMEFDKRIQESKEKAMEDNKKKAEESGNVITQVMNDDGELVNVANMNSTEISLMENKDVSVADIRKELFEGDNVVTDKNTDHGASELMSNQESSGSSDKTEE